MSHSGSVNTQAGREKKSVALWSIFASVIMILGKVAAGILTGSLAILTDALHSFLDMSASIVTYFAVRLSDKPADRDHHFGHGKIESLAALVQVTLLLITCGAIMYEAIKRLLDAGYSTVGFSIWAVAVIIGSILIDLTRVRALKKVAKKYSSQALAADALNFSTDIYSSLVVLFSMAAIRLGFPWADPVAAIGVALLILTAVIRMAREAIDILLDRAPAELEIDLRRRAEAFDQIQGVERLRTRSDGRQIFADMILSVDRTLSFAAAGDLKEKILGDFEHSFPDVDVTLTFKPVSTDYEEKTDAIRFIVSLFGLSLHHLILKKIAGGYFASMHIELPGDMSLAQAHEKVNEITVKLHKEIASLKRVAIHTEPLEERSRDDSTGVNSDIENMEYRVRQIVESFPGVEDCHNIAVTPHAGGLALSADMRLDGSLPLDSSHDISDQVEQKLKLKIKELVSVTLHLEPLK